MDKCLPQPPNASAWVSNFTEDDFRKISFRIDQKVWVHKSYSEMMLKSMLFFVILMFSLVGNFLIIRVIIKFKNSRNCTNLFICNMAIADLFTTVTCAWAALINNLFQNYVLGEFFCKTETTTKVFFMLASTFSLTWISCDRLIGIIRPFRNPGRKNHALLTMAVIWAVSFLIPLPVYFWREYRTRQWCDYYEIWCKEDTKKIEVYWFFILAFLVYIPLTVMTFAYCAVICKIKQYEQMISTEENSIKIRHRRKVIFMLFIYLITSAICWSPLQLTVFYRFSHLKSPDSVKPWHEEMKFWAHVLASLNSAANPIIYGINNESFKRAICLLYPKLAVLLKLDKCSPRKYIKQEKPGENLPKSAFTITNGRLKGISGKSQKIEMKKITMKAI